MYARETSPEVVVIGAGAFGGWTALALRERGASVTLVDAYGPGNSRSSSGGETRQIRAGYADRELYTRWVLEAFGLWRAREQEWGKRLLFETGRILLAPEWNESLKVTQAVLDKYKVPNERLSHGRGEAALPADERRGGRRRRFSSRPPAFSRRAKAAWPSPMRSRRRAGRFRIARAQLGRQSGSRLLDVALSSGSSLAAATYVFACGPWLRKVFPDLMQKKLFTPRRDVFFFGTPPGDDRFSYPNFPNYSEEGEQLRLLRLPQHRPSRLQGLPGGRADRLRSRHRRADRLGLPGEAGARLPRAPLSRALANQPLVESRVCQLEMSVDEHFIIDRHPGLENVWLVGGGSGHGYKHGPVVGRVRRGPRARQGPQS